MDIEKYIAGKKSGLSSIELHGDSTLLVFWPDGFNETDGTPKPCKEQGYQPADIAAMKAAAVAAVTAAEEALAKAQSRVAMHDDLLADAAVFQPQIEANLKAAQEKAAADALAAQATGTVELVSAAPVK
jgi:hypothetical protein